MLDVHEKRLKVNDNETTKSDDQGESTKNEADTSSTHSTANSSGINMDASFSSQSTNLTTNTSFHELSSLSDFLVTDSGSSLDSIGLTITLACGHSIDITAPLRLEKCPKCDKRISKKTQKKILALQKANKVQD